MKDIKDTLLESINKSISKIRVIEAIAELVKNIFYNEFHFAYILSYFLAEKLGFDKIRHLLQCNKDKIDKGYCIFLSNKERNQDFKKLTGNTFDGDIIDPVNDEIENFSYLLLELKK